MKNLKGFWTKNSLSDFQKIGWYLRKSDEKLMEKIKMLNLNDLVEIITKEDAFKLTKAKIDAAKETEILDNLNRIYKSIRRAINDEEFSVGFDVIFREENNAKFVKEFLESDVGGAYKVSMRYNEEYQLANFTIEWR